MSVTSRVIKNVKRRELVTKAKLTLSTAVSIRTAVVEQTLACWRPRSNLNGIRLYLRPLSGRNHFHHLPQPSQSHHRRQPAATSKTQPPRRDRDDLLPIKNTHGVRTFEADFWIFIGFMSPEGEARGISKGLGYSVDGESNIPDFHLDFC